MFPKATNAHTGPIKVSINLMLLKSSVVHTSACSKSRWCYDESQHKSMAQPRGSHDRHGSSALCPRLDRALLAGMGLSVDLHGHIAPHHALSHETRPSAA